MKIMHAVAIIKDANQRTIIEPVILSLPYSGKNSNIGNTITNVKLELNIIQNRERSE